MVGIRYGQCAIPSQQRSACASRHHCALGKDGGAGPDQGRKRRDTWRRQEETITPVPKPCRGLTRPRPPGAQSIAGRKLFSAASDNLSAHLHWLSDLQGRNNMSGKHPHFWVLTMVIAAIAASSAI